MPQSADFFAAFKDFLRNIFRFNPAKVPDIRVIGGAIPLFQQGVWWRHSRSGGSIASGHGNLRVRWCLFFAAWALLLAGCTYYKLGPDAINSDRRDYNQVLNRTENTQLLQNIVRVKNRESPQFMDVQQISAESAFNIGTGSVTMNSTGRFLGPVQPDLGYSAQPTITYLPLSGAALVSQLSTPFSVDSIAAMFNSDWPIGAVLDMTGDRLTPHFYDDYAAIDTIMELEHYNAIMITGGSSRSLSGDTSDNPPGTAISIGITASAASETGGPAAPPTPPDDTLLIFLKPNRNGPHGASDRRMISILWRRLRNIFPPHKNGKGATTLGSNVIAIYTVPDKESSQLRSPDMTFHSAYGVLSAASRQPFVAFVSRPQYCKIISEPWNQDCLWHLRHSEGTGGGFYILSGKDLKTRRCYKSRRPCRPKRGGAACQPSGKLALTNWLIAASECNRNQHWKCRASRILRQLLAHDRPDQKMPCEKFCRPGKSGKARSVPLGCTGSQHGLRAANLNRVAMASSLHPQFRSRGIHGNGASNAILGKGSPHPRFNTIDPCGIIPLCDKRRLDAMERLLGSRRRYILIIHSKSRPKSGQAYVKFQDHWNSKWYYISNHDQISKDNFLLFSQLIILQSQPPSTPPPSPTISVGGG